MGPWLIKALNFMLLGASCYLVADAVTEIGGEALEPPPLQNEVVRPAESTEAALVSPNAILDRNLFGAQLAGEVQLNAAPDESEAELEETKLPLRLLGTAAATDTFRSRAAIQDEKLRKHLVVGIGDEIEGHTRVRVKDIQRTRVVLDNRGKLEELLLHEDGPRVAAAPPRRPTPGARQARRAPDRASMGDRLAQLKGADGQGLSRILSSARIVPEYDPSNGEMLGMKVDAIKADSLLQKVGLLNGDVITEVNGIVVDRLEATSAIFEELATADEINVAATRGQEAVFLSASANEVMEQ
jgi:type II secretion system protein C